MYVVEAVERCPICGGKGQFYDEEEERGDGNYMVRLDKCDDCGTYYQNPRLTEDALKEYHQKGWYQLGYPRNEIGEQRRADRLTLLLQRFKLHPKRCLDYGAAHGFLLKNLKNSFSADIVGLEYDPRFSVIDDMFINKEQIEGTFDLITCIHTLEHFRDPIEEMKWMVDRLDPNGTILLELPLVLKITLPHIYTFNMASIQLMLNNLGLHYLYLESSDMCDILIGDKYSDFKVEKVYYNFDSPDFTTEKEFTQWFRNSLSS